METIYLVHTGKVNYSKKPGFFKEQNVYIEGTVFMKPTVLIFLFDISTSMLDKIV